MKALGPVYELVLHLPILIIGFWWISLPLYYLLLGFEFWSIERVARETGRTKGPIQIVVLQALLPFVPVALYPFLLEQLQGGTPPELNELAQSSAWAGLLLAFMGFAAFGLVRRGALVQGKPGSTKTVENLPPPGVGASDFLANPYARRESLRTVRVLKYEP